MTDDANVLTTQNALEFIIRNQVGHPDLRATCRDALVLIELQQHEIERLRQRCAEAEQEADGLSGDRDEAEARAEAAERERDELRAEGRTAAARRHGNGDTGRGLLPRGR